MFRFPWLAAWPLTVAQGGAKSFDDRLIFERGRQGLRWGSSGRKTQDPSELTAGGNTVS